jgi:membrane associated rhomboid family serine protease
MSGGGGASGKRARSAGPDGDPASAAFYNPIATCVAVAVLSLVFLAQWWGRAVGEDGSGYAVYLVGGLHASSVREGEFFRIVTAPLLHLHVHHLGFNVAGLLALGGALEAQVGHARFLLVVALSMLAGSMAALALPSPAGVVVGASGAVFGVVGAWSALVLRHWQAPPPLLHRARWALPIVLAADAALALLAPGKVGWSVHLGGFAGGMAAMALLSRGGRPIPLGRSSRRIRLAAAGLAALFLWGVAADLQRVASGRICEVALRDDLSQAVRDGFTAALRDLPVACAGLEPGPPPATPVNSETPERPRTRSNASRRGP